MTPNRDFDKAFASIFGLVNNRHLPTVQAPRPLSPTPSDLPTLPDSEMAEGDQAEIRR